MSKIKEKTTATDFRKNFETSSDLEIIINKQNKAISDTDYIGTGCEVQIREKATKTVLQEYECMLYGDVNGDGKISAMDYTLIKNHIMEVQQITDTSQKLTADVNNDNRVSTMDYTLIKNHIMDIQKIELR